MVEYDHRTARQNEWSSMTPEERDRLTRLEGSVAQLAKNDEHLESRIERMDGKLDRLLTAAAMGKGAWWAILKVGGVLSLMVGIAVWVWEQLQRHP